MIIKNILCRGKKQIELLREANLATPPDLSEEKPTDVPTRSPDGPTRPRLVPSEDTCQKVCMYKFYCIASDCTMFTVMATITLCNTIITSRGI